MKNRIFYFSITLFLMAFSLFAGYAIKEYNMLSPSFFTYNANLAIKHTINNIKDNEIKNIVPEVTETKKLNKTFVRLEPDGSRFYYEEEISIHIINTTAFGGFYNPFDKNSIYINSFNNTKAMGHEFCHLILFKSGIKDLRVNEDVCYTLNENYEFGVDKP